MSPTARISPIYCLFFLTLEPLTAIGGFIAAYFTPAYYLNETYVDAPFRFLHDRLPPSVSIVVQQLANLYLLFALNEATVLRMAAKSDEKSPSWYVFFGMEWTLVDLRVWRTLLTCLLIADAGHLWSVRSLGLEFYWNVNTWNAMAWGNLFVVYVGALTRICFLLGFGVRKIEQDVSGKKLK